MVARVHEKIANQRLDYQYKISLKLTCENQAIAVEDLTKLAKQIIKVSYLRIP